MASVEMTLQEIQSFENQMLLAVSKICDDNDIMYYLNAGSVLGAVRHNGPIPWDTDVDILIYFHDIPRFVEACRTSLPDNMYVDHYSINPDTYILFPRIGIKGYRTDRMHIDCFPLVGLPNSKEEQIKFSKRSDFLKKMYLVKKARLRRNKIMRTIETGLGKIALSCFSDKKLIKMFNDHCSTYSSENAAFIMNPCGHYGIKNILSRDVFGKGAMVPYANIMLRIPEKYDEYLKHYYGDYMKWPKSWEDDMKRTYEIYKTEK